MYENFDSIYGKAKLSSLPFANGKIFAVVGASSANNAQLTALFASDITGVARTFPTLTLALAACVAGRGDMIVLAPDFTTAPSAAELLSMEQKGVVVMPMGLQQLRPGAFRTYRQPGTLPQTTNSPIFTVTGRVRLVQIVGQVTTAIQAQADAVKLTAVPTVGSAVDICATGDVNAAAVGTQLYITGTLATGLQISAGGAQLYQSQALVITAGTINLNAAASNTGAVKWYVDWEPLDPGATVVAA